MRAHFDRGIRLGATLGVLLVVHTVAAQQALIPDAVRTAADRISEAQLRQDLEFLASDELKGRNTPSPGFDAAADYIEKRLRSAGLKPAGDNGTYRQHYVMRETTLETGGATLTIGRRSFTLGDDFTLRTFAGELNTGAAAAVYVGHGWTADGVDPYRGLDVKGKVVVVHAPSARPQGAKIQNLGRVIIGGTSPIVEAHRRGALAVVALHSNEPQRDAGQGGPRPTVRRELDPAVPSAYAAPVLTSIQLGAQATQALLEGTTIDPARLAEQTKSQEYPASFVLPSTVTLRLPAKAVVHRPFNVVGIVEGTDPALKNEYIVIESHLDGAVGSRTVDGDSIYNSADDNATGSAANISIAEQMMTTRPRRSVIFLWDSGEEQGLWGTRQFVANPPVPLASIVALINIDMIGANRAPGSPDVKDERVTGPNEVFLIGPGVLSDRAASFINRVNDAYLKLTFNRKYDTPESEFFYPRTDAGPFLERNVLTIGFTTGLHDRYHLPADEARFLDVPKMAAIARTVFAVVHALGQADERPRIEKPIPPTVLRVGGNTAQYRSRIAVYDLETGSSRVVHEADGVWEAPNWSRDGTFLLANSGGRLYRIGLDGRTAPEPLALDSSLRANNDHDYSPDGRRLAISASSPASRQSQIYVAESSGSNPRLVVTAAPSYFHGWSPDGKYLAFVANRDGKQYDLYRVPADGGAEERLTSDPAADDGPDYSPDGKWIYFNSNRGGGWNIWRMPADGAGPDDRQAERITDDALEDWFPHPSPDGRHLLFLSFPAGTAGHNDRTLRVQLRMVPMPSTGGASARPRMLAEITGGQGTINVNSWSPDSRRFGYVTYELLR